MSFEYNFTSSSSSDDDSDLENCNNSKLCKRVRITQELYRALFIEPEFGLNVREKDAKLITLENENLALKMQLKIAHDKLQNYAKQANIDVEKETLYKQIDEKTIEVAMLNKEVEWRKAALHDSGNVIAQLIQQLEVQKQKYNEKFKKVYLQCQKQTLGFNDLCPFCASKEEMLLELRTNLNQKEATHKQAEALQNEIIKEKENQIKNLTEEIGDLKSHLDERETQMKLMSYKPVSNVELDILQSKIELLTNLKNGCNVCFQMLCATIDENEQQDLSCNLLKESLKYLEELCCEQTTDNIKQIKSAIAQIELSGLKIALISEHIEMLKMLFNRTIEESLEVMCAVHLEMKQELEKEILFKLDAKVKQQKINEKKPKAKEQRKQQKEENELKTENVQLKQEMAELKWKMAQDQRKRTLELKHMEQLVQAHGREGEKSEIKWKMSE